MPRRLPGNAALLAFEAAARHGSFARAAAELALTEGAISRQIARLEAYLGTPLFERVGNRVRLLPPGSRYAAQVREILARLERDSLALMGQPPGGSSLEIAVLPTFASRWLIPRLKGFQDRHPEITVHLSEALAPFLLADSGFDAAIHFDHPAWTGLATYPLCHEVLIPVCHPALLPSAGAPPSLDALPRLHRRQNPLAWQHYAEETGLTLTHPARGPRYDLHAMLIEAALAGLGVALVPRLYVEEDLAAGRLVSPWPPGTTIAKTFCLILPQALGATAADSGGGPLHAFSAWLRGVAAGEGGAGGE